MKKRAWIEINLDKLEHNYNEIKKQISDKTEVMAIVKADGYGHGDTMVAEHLHNIGCKKFGVSNIKEAIAVRKVARNSEILNLGYLSPENCRYLYENDIIQTILNIDYARKLNSELEKHNKTIKCHIKIDTGMTRVGVDMFCENAIDNIAEICDMKNLDVIGIYSHLSVADEFSDSDIDFTKQQFEVFNKAIKDLENRGYNIKEKHISNSAGVLRYQEMNLDIVRPGTIIYGLSPSKDMNENIENLQQIVELKATVSMVKEVNEDRYVSYGRNFKTTKKTKLATVTIGYADGYSRKMSSVGTVSINGKLAKIAGNVCMDQIVLDVSEVENVAAGDEVTLIGTDGIAPTMMEISKIVGTIDIDVSCSFGKRLERVYIKNGREI